MNILRKHRALIHISNVDAVARKTYNVLLSNSFSSGDKGWHEIPLGQIKSAAGINDTSNANLKKQIINLMKNPIELDILNGDWHALCLISEAKIEDGILKYRLPDTILNALFNPDMYAIIDLAVIKGLRSKYAIALYELAIDYMKKEIPKMTIEMFRKLMGVDPKKYRQSFTAFENKVIKPAVKEINNNEKIDFKIRYETFRTGRRITHIKFYIDKKKKEYKGIADDIELRNFIENLKDCFLGVHFFSGELDGTRYELAFNRKGLLFDPVSMKVFTKDRSLKIYKMLFDRYINDEDLKNYFDNCKAYIEEENDVLTKLKGLFIEYNGEKHKILRAYDVSESSVCIEIKHCENGFERPVVIKRDLAISLTKNDRLKYAKNA